MYLRKNDVLKDSQDITEIRKMSSDGENALERIGYKELMGLISTMPVGFRTVFNLYVLEGFTHKEIADMLGITESTSRTQLSRGRIWLQDRIERMYGKQ